MQLEGSFTLQGKSPVSQMQFSADAPPLTHERLFPVLLQPGAEQTQVQLACV